MTRDDIIRMAEDVGMTGLSLIDVGYLERFAALVAAAEREACAKLVWITLNSEDEYVSPRQTIANAILARGTNDAACNKSR